MNFSGYFILAAGVASIVLAQVAVAGSERESKTIKIIQQTTNRNIKNGVFRRATIALRVGHINGTHLVGKSEKIFFDVIKAAKQIVLENPKEAVRLILLGIKNTLAVLVVSGVPALKSFGEALLYSNEQTGQGLVNSCQLIQKGGVKVVDALHNAEDLLNQVVDSADEITKELYLEELIEALSLIVESGFAGTYNNIVASIKNAVQILINAQSCMSMKPGQIIENLNCEVAAIDRDASSAVQAVKKAAQNALSWGANADLVTKFKNTIICGLGDFVKKMGKTMLDVKNLKKIVVTEPSTAKLMMFNLAEQLKSDIHEIVAKILLAIGDEALTVNKQSNDKADAAILEVEQSTFICFVSIDMTVTLIGNGNGGDSPLVGVDAALETLDYGNDLFLRGMVKISYTLFDLLYG